MGHDPRGEDCGGGGNSYGGGEGGWTDQHALLLIRTL